MAMMFGRFDIVGELSKSELGAVYKATDTESNQTVALKTVRLDTLGDGPSAFVETLLAEGERTRELQSQHVAVLYGAGEIEHQFCAAMEYVQGNSIATMLSRKEGFSIWDLLDVTRQVCSGLDQAASQHVVHYSLEPSKVMVQWDGLVKILGYGISSMSLIGTHAGSGLGKLLPYASPEQVSGGTVDLRSNLFTWGAILYEMVADRRAFDATDAPALEKEILNDMPPAPSSLNPKIHPAVSTLIMKALAKNPDERYQTARELADDLEKCKEGGARQASAGAKKAAPKPVVSDAERVVAASKFVGSKSEPRSLESLPPVQPQTPVPPRAMAAAASAGSSFQSTFDSGSPLIEESAKHEFTVTPQPVSSAAVAEPETTTSAPAMADPLMSAPASAGSARSFSEIDELPPLKEPIFAPPPPPLPVPEPEERTPVTDLRPSLPHSAVERPRIQPREVAEKALTEIKTLPPQLMLYSVLGAVALILVVAVALYFHVRSQDDDGTAAPRPARQAATQPQPEAPVAPAPAPGAVAAVEAPPAEAEPEVVVRQIAKPNARGRKQLSKSAPVAAVPGQVQVDSNPQGAQIQIDGKIDPEWITPYNVTGLNPGQHSISLSKTGYSPDTRSVDITSGSKSFVVVHLAPINALLVLNSTPPGADVLIDGKSTGRVTPAQFAVDKGSHTVLLRKPGFLDETTSADLGPGQNFQFSPAMRPLGNADEIKTVGKFKKIFGGKGDSTAGMGSVSLRTQPKGAQIAVNEKLLDRTSPAEFMVGPGNYVIDITLTGFKPVHKIITVEKGGKVAIDETLDRQ
jgi:serine/threonine protein kinase